MNPEDLLSRSKHIAISLPGQVREQDIQTAFSLLYALKKLGKKVALEGRILEQKPFLLRQILPRDKTFVVSLKGLAPWISRVHYEKNDKDLKLFFTLQQGEISPENVAFESVSEADLTVIVGDSGQELKREGHLITRARDFLPSCMELLPEASRGSVRLIGKIAAKLTYFAKTNVYFADISQKDFKECLVSSKFLIGAVQTAQELLESQSSILLLYESFIGETKGLLWTKQESLKELALSFGKGDKKGDWTLISLSPDIDYSTVVAKVKSSL